MDCMAFTTGHILVKTPNNWTLEGINFHTSCANWNLKNFGIIRNKDITLKELMETPHFVPEKVPF